jgi:hypothetical protein
MNTITIKTTVGDDTFDMLADFFKKFMGQEVEILLKSKSEKVSPLTGQRLPKPGIHQATSNDMSWLDDPWIVDDATPMTRDEMYDRV